MFNVGPMELIVLAIVGVVVVGPDRLPNLARDAARLIKQLRDVATGARQQLQDELGPEFADVDLRNLNPRAAIQRAVLGEDLNLGQFDPRRWDARSAASNLLRDDEPAGSVADAADEPVSMAKHDPGPAATVTPVATSAERPKPRPRPVPRVAVPSGPATPYDADAT